MSSCQVYNTGLGVLKHIPCSRVIHLGDRKFSYTSFLKRLIEYCTLYTNKDCDNIVNEISKIYENNIKAKEEYYVVIPVQNLDNDTIECSFYPKKLSTLYQPYTVRISKREFSELSSEMLYSLYRKAWSFGEEEYSYLILELWENDYAIQFADRTVFFHNFYIMRKEFNAIISCQPIQGVLEYTRDNKAIYVET